MPTFSDPQTTQNPAVGVHATAALLNVWRDDQDVLHDPTGQAGCAVTRATDLAMSGATLILWTSETFDTGTMHDNVTNNSRMTVPSGMDGIWLLGVNARESGASGVTLDLRKNGTTKLVSKLRPTGSAISVCFLASLVATDYIEAIATTGTTLVATVGLRLNAFARWIGSTQ